MRGVRNALLFLALILAFFWKPLTGDFINVPMDYLQTLPPWTFLTNDHHVLNSDMNDLALQLVDWAHVVRESWKSFTPPIWNHYNAAGYPLLANGQSSAFSPLRLLTLPFPLGKAMTIEASLKIFLALLFTFLFCRQRGKSELASTIAAIGFGFGGFITVWIHFPIATSACFLPAAMYLIDRLAKRPTIGTFAAIAFVWAALIYGGHPETAAHIALLGVPYAMWIVFVDRAAPPRMLVMLLGAMFVAGLLAMPFLAPFAEAVTKSKRYAEINTQHWSAKNLPYSNLESLVVAVQPHIYGRRPIEQGWGASQPDPMSAFAGTFALASWFANVVFVIRRRAWRSRELFFAVFTLFVLGIFMSWPGIGTAIHVLLPIVAHARTRLLFCFLLAVQSADAIDRVRAGERTPMLAGIAAAAASIVIVFKWVWFPYKELLHSALVAAIPSVIVLVIAILFTLLRNRWATIILGIAVTAEMFSYFRGWSPPLPGSKLAPVTPLIAKLQKLAAETPPTEPFRVAGIDAMLFPNSNALYGIEDIRAHDPMANQRYLHFLELTAKYNPKEYAAMLPNANASVFDFLNVRYVLDNPRLEKDPERYRVVYDGADGRIFENRHVLPRFYPVRNVLLEFNDAEFTRKLIANQEWGQTALIEDLDVEAPQMRDDFFKPRPPNAPLATSKIVEGSPTRYRIRVDAPRWTLVVSSIPWWPGWQVTRNGTRIQPIRVNSAFLGFAVPPGTTDVRVWYAPRSFWAGVGVGLTALAALLVGVWRRQSPLW